MKLKNCHIEKLLEHIRINKKRLICFGAGEYLSKCCKYYEMYNFFDKIYAILDNNKTIFDYNGSIKAIIHPSTFFESLSDNDILILVTSECYYHEIIESLGKYGHISDIECYIGYLVVNTPISLEFPIQNNKIQRISKTLHYTWFGKKELPKEQRAYLESWERYCPDYKIIRWDEKNYDISKNAYIYEAYKHKKYSFVSDYARLDIVYNFGGIYMDTDVELIRSLDDLLYDDAFCGLSTIDQVNTGIGFGAKPNFPILAEMMNAYDGVSFVNEDGSLNLKNNGAYQTPVLNKYGLESKNITQLIQGMRVYSTDVFSPVDYLDNPICFTANTHAVHHYAASWIDKESKYWQLRQNCSQFWKSNLEKCLINE